MKFVLIVPSLYVCLFWKKGFKTIADCIKMMGTLTFQGSGELTAFPTFNIIVHFELISGPLYIFP